MPIRFVCLANSIKEGGRCVAGILLDRKNNPIIGNLGPKWIRPIYTNEHGEIPKELVAHISLLDIIELEINSYLSLGYQSENAYFDEHSINVIDSFPVERLESLIEDERPKLFWNDKKAIHIDNIHLLHHSLMLIRTTDFEVKEMLYDDKPNKPQIRIEFLYKRTRYDFPVTDPEFFAKYRKDPNYRDGLRQLFLTLSVGLPHNDFHFKLIAGIMQE